ncbi:hypothetical protein QTH87_12755 [Variovorax sp. J22P168]|uniref:hypothetical protein n=1 Tax=Variovorax jilinensis TaxID=3053513 RepID=UPI0025749CD1|nr:hypothetical protein [Variovorax sp. J22P168]MDM0013306.1 hypothetical protein [Variovorax sp. J22P168]
MDGSLNTTEFKSPEQIAEATREAVRVTGGGDRAEIDHAARSTRPKPGRAAELLDELKSRGRRMREQGGNYVAERPMSSVMMAAAGGAAFTTLMWAALRNTRH